METLNIVPEEVVKVIDDLHNRLRHERVPYCPISDDQTKILEGHFGPIVGDLEHPTLLRETTIPGRIEGFTNKIFYWAYRDADGKLQFGLSGHSAPRKNN